VLQDATVQGEFFKWHLTPADFDDFSLMNHDIQEALLEEKKYDKRMGQLNFRSFDKEKFKLDPYSEKVRNEQIAKQRKRRAVCIQTGDSATFRGVALQHSPNKPWSFIVVNGVWSDEIT
jgi:hypothetical protein